MRLSLRLAGILTILVAALVMGCQSAAPQPAAPQPAAPQPAAAKPAAQQPAAKPAAAQPAAKPAAPAQPAAPSFPTRPIELVVPFAPGGGSGITSELFNKSVVTHKFSPQPLNIVYKPGASGQVGWAYLAGKKGDDYSFATATSSFITGPLSGQSPLTFDQFTPLAAMAMDENLMVTFPSSPYKTVKDIIDAAKAKPGSVTIAGTGASGSDATIAAMIEQEAKVKLNMIPFNSGAEVNAAILGGQVDLAISNPNELFPNIEAGKLRPIVVFGANRMKAVNDVPTMKESGYNIIYSSARGFVAPAGISKDAEKWYIDLMTKVGKSPEWEDYVSKNMMTNVLIGGSEYLKYLEEEREKFKAIFEAMGLLKK